MPTEKLNFEDLIKEYIEVTESIDITKFKEENKNRYQWQPQPGHGYLLENNTYTVL